MPSPFLDPLLPAPAPADARYIWAVVTQSSPLRIRVDGDRTPLGITPDALVSGLSVGQRVYCQILNRRLVVLGTSGGAGRLAAVNNIGAGNDPDTLTDTGWYSGYNWTGSLAGFGIGSLEVVKYSADWIMQRFTTMSASPYVLVRTRHSGTTWSPWVNMVGESEVFGGEIIRRDVNGRAKVAYPSAYGDIANKDYVENRITDVVAWDTGLINTQIIYTPWTFFTPTVAGMTINNGNVYARHKIVGKTAEVIIAIIFGSTTTITNYPRVDLPFTWAMGFCEVMFTRSGVNLYKGFGIASGVSVYGYASSPTTPHQAEDLGSSAPWGGAWKAGDDIQIYARGPIY